MHGPELLILGGIIFAGFACQWIAWRLRLPSILLLLLTGIVVGPLSGVLHPDDLFGDLLEPMVSLAVAIILYEGSLTLKLGEIRGHGAVVRNLVTLGVAITWIGATFSARFFLGWDIFLSALFGAIVTVSGPTVIIPLLRTLRPNRRLSSIFRWEGILVDPLGAILAVLVYDFIVVVQTAATTSQLFVTFGLIAAAGVILGVAAGHAFGFVLQRHWIPDYLRDYAALASVITVFAIGETIASESGLLAVTIMGVWQANQQKPDYSDILDFKESLTLVLVASLFIILAARIDLAGLQQLGLGAVAVLLFLQLVSGPARAFICSIGSNLNWRERLYLGWLFPRGIVAAAVSALFALRLESMDYPGADGLVSMVFLIIVGTVVIQSITGGFLARALKVADPEPNGVLVVGANSVSLAFADALAEAGERVLVASMSWKGISMARMRGLRVFFGSPVSAYAERKLDLIGLGNLLALSGRPDLNELACVKYSFDFGRDSIFTVPGRSESRHEKHQITGESAGRLLFEGKISFEELQVKVDAGVVARTTNITESYSFDDYRDQNPDALLLFVREPSGRLRFPADENGPVAVPPGSSVTSWIPANGNGGNHRQA